MKLKTAIFFVALLQAAASNASTILCDDCSSAAMLQTAKDKATTLRFGTHDIGVLNVNGADYNSYRATVSKDYNTGATIVAIQKQQSSSELQIESSARDVLTAVSEFKNAASGKIILPTDTPYKSATTALSEPSAFSTYATHIIRNSSQIQNKVTAIAAQIETLAANAQVEASSVVLSIATKLSSGVSTWVVFPDGSSLEVTITFQNNLANGLVMNLTAGNYALDSEGNLIPISQTQLSNFRATNRQMNLQGFPNYVEKLGGYNSFGSGYKISCIITSVKCQEKQCSYTFKCSD